MSAPVRRSVFMSALLRSHEHKIIGKKFIGVRSVRWWMCCGGCAGLIYTLTVKQRQITKLRATNYSGSPEEWHAILASALLQQHPPPSDPEREKAVEGLELVASVTPGERLSIVVRKNIGGITVPAAFPLPRTLKS